MLTGMAMFAGLKLLENMACGGRMLGVGMGTPVGVGAGWGLPGFGGIAVELGVIGSVKGGEVEGSGLGSSILSRRSMSYVSTDG